MAFLNQTDRVAEIRDVADDCNDSDHDDSSPEQGLSTAPSYGDFPWSKNTASNRDSLAASAAVSIQHESIGQSRSSFGLQSPRRVPARALDALGRLQPRREAFVPRTDFPVTAATAPLSSVLSKSSAKTGKPILPLPQYSEKEGRGDRNLPLGQLQAGDIVMSLSIGAALDPRKMDNDKGIIEAPGYGFMEIKDRPYCILAKTGFGGFRVVPMKSSGRRGPVNLPSRRQAFVLLVANPGEEERFVHGIGLDRTVWVRDEQGYYPKEGRVKSQFSATFGSYLAMDELTWLPSQYPFEKRGSFDRESIDFLTQFYHETNTAIMVPPGQQRRAMSDMRFPPARSLDRTPPARAQRDYDRKRRRSRSPLQEHEIARRRRRSSPFRNRSANSPPRRLDAPSRDSFRSSETRPRDNLVTPQDTHHPAGRPVSPSSGQENKPSAAPHGLSGRSVRSSGPLPPQFKVFDERNTDQYTPKKSHRS